MPKSLSKISEPKSAAKDSSNCQFRSNMPSAPDPCPAMRPVRRMLIAQAITDDLTLVSNETAFDCYGVRRLW